MRYPDAVWEPVSYGDGGAYTGGPFRIVLHTTEIGSLTSSDAELHRHYASHFIVSADKVVQLVDTDRAAMSLQHTGDPQTNRLSAIQIEMVGYAGHRKEPAMLQQTRKLCAWLMKEYNIPPVWPNGYCVPAINGQDSNHHNRNPLIWSTHGGFYGHEHVPENFHWDPALERDECDFVTGGYIPAPPIPVNAVYVDSGDSLYSIAHKFGLDVVELEKLNSIGPPYIIHPGQKLLLKGE